MYEQMNASECRTQQQKKKVKNMLLDGNLLTEIPSNLHHFVNLQLLSINENTLDNCSELQRCNNLSNFLARKCNLKKVPVQIFSLTNLVKLDLSMNSILMVPVQISILTGLINLNMNQNHLVYLPEELCECSNLKVINVGKNNLEKMPDTIYKLQELSFLICNDNCLTTLPDRMGELKCLKRINLSGNIKLKNWPSSLENLCNLKALDICCTSIPTIPENISKLTNLNALRLPYFQSFTHIPPLYSLQTLSFIDFRNDYKFSLPLGIDELVHLKQLYIQRCNMTNIQHLKTLKNLQILDISEIKLSRIDAKIFNNCQKLLELKIRQSGLQNFPNLSKCKKLNKINLDGNQIVQIPYNCIKGLVNIKQFTISSNKLTYFPLSILNFNNLRILQAQSNPLRDIVNERSLYEQQLSRLSLPVWPKLISLNLRNTQFDNVPKILMQCTKLVYLNISTHKITTIPTEIGNLVNLRIFCMYHNQITKIPVEMSKMKKLEQIFLTSNKITHIPLQLQQICNLKILNLDNNPIQYFQNLEWIIDKKIQFGTLRDRIRSI